MIDRDKCPMCADGEVTRSEGKLEQSGATYLPTAVWTCNVCGYVRYEPAMAAHWRPTEVRAGSMAAPLEALNHLQKAAA